MVSRYRSTHLFLACLLSQPSVGKEGDNATPSLTSHRTWHGSLSTQTSQPPATPQPADSHILHRIPPGAEATNVLVGSVEFLSAPVMAFVRLQDACELTNLTEVPLPVRFIFILLGPTGSSSLDYHEIGRSISTLMADEVCISFLACGFYTRDIDVHMSIHLSCSCTALKRLNVLYFLQHMVPHLFWFSQ